MCRYALFSALLLLCLSTVALCQMPDMPPMGDDMFDVQGAEFDAPTSYEAPFLSSKKAAPIISKAPRMRLTAVPYTYEKPVTHYETVTVPTSHIVDDEVLTFETVPMTRGKKGAGYGGGYGGFAVDAAGYHGAGLWQGPGGLWPGLGYGQRVHACTLPAVVVAVHHSSVWPACFSLV